MSIWDITILTLYSVRIQSNIDQQMRYVQAGIKARLDYRPANGRFAQKEAYQTTDMHWCALAAEVKSLIAGRKTAWSEAEMHYAFWLTYHSQRLAQLMGGQKAPQPEHFQIAYAEKKTGAQLPSAGGQTQKG